MICSNPLDMTHIRWNGLESNTTDGIVPKSIIKDINNNVKVFLKADNYGVGYGFYGFSTLSERIGTILGKYLNIIDVVDYKLIYSSVIIKGENHKGFINLSKNFNPNKSFIPVEKIYDSRSKLSVKDYLFDLGYREQLECMWIFDYIISNMDRHGKNLEINPDTKKFAPLFDHGLTRIGNTSSLDKLADFNDDTIVNNFIGERTLIGNLKQVENSYRIPKRSVLKEMLITYLHNTCTIDEINVIFNFLESRIYKVINLGKLREEN